MENKEKKIVLKKKKPNLLQKVYLLLKDPKKRPLYICLFILPFIILIAVFGVIAYKEAKSLVALAKNDTTAEVDSSHIISSMNYVLRDNATDVQEEYFAELKSAIDNNTTDDATAAGLVCKNFVADFFTWTNKAGQYDVGGLYYVYNGEQEETGDYKPLLYTEIRDTFYKYINEYIDTYGAENLLEVESVNVTSATVSPVDYEIWEKTGYQSEGVDSDGEESFSKVYECAEYDTYLVTCSWTYKASSVFDTSKYPTKMNFAVVLRQGRYEIVEMQEGSINVEDFTY